MGKIFLLKNHIENTKFMEDLHNHQPSIKFTYTFSKIVSLCLIWMSNYQGVSLPQIYISSPQTDTNIYILCHPNQIIPSAPLYIVKHFE